MNVSYSECAIDAQLINLDGPLNDTLAEQVKQTFHDVAGQGINRVIVNLANVSVIDSRGLSALVAGYKLFGSQPQNFILAMPTDQPKLLFELTGFDKIFHIADHVPQPATVLV